MYKKEIENKINNLLKNNINILSLNKLYYDIGKILFNENNINLNELEIFLKSKYGIVICFTRRNFKNMILAYNENKNIEKNINWENIINNKINDNLLNELIELKKIIKEENYDTTY